MHRREFFRTASCGLIAGFHPQSGHCLSSLPLIESSLARKRDNWAFVGRSQWTEDAQGVINNPTWVRATANVLDYWPHETDDRQKQDFAFLQGAWLTDLDLSVRVKLFVQSTSGQVVFRAQDSRRFYELEVRCMGEKGGYELTLWVADAYGFRRRLAHGMAGTMDLRSAKDQNPKWDTIRILARGPHLEAWLNEDRVIGVQDSTYAAGVPGLGALGRIEFSDLQVRGRRTSPHRPWKIVPGEAPPYLYPYKSDTVDLTKPTIPRMSWPTGAVLADGEIVLLREVNPRTGYSAGKGTMLVRSRDNGRTWSEEVLIDGLALYWPFEHRDGRLSALTSVTFDDRGNVLSKFTPDTYRAIDEGKIKVRREVMLAYSEDRGKTWGRPQPLWVGERPLSAYGNFWTYSGFLRLSDGSLLWTPYGGKSENTKVEERTNQTFALRSEDDGKTWSVPVPVETSRKDTNEGSAAELANGDLLIFMRSVRAPCLWKARSKDKGRTWLPLETTDITLDCPQFLRTSKGLLVLETRGGGLEFSSGEGATWSSLWNIGRFVHMGCLLETKDGALLVAHLDAGFADITKVRATRFRVTAQGLSAAD